MSSSVNSITARTQGSQLPQYLAGMYGLMIVWASLEPFAGWADPPPGTSFFLWSFTPSRTTRFDIAINVFAYLPFGFFLALIGNHATPLARIVRALSIAAALTVALETLQQYLPTRDASTVDVLTNAMGALLGALCALRLGPRSPLRRRVSQWRYRTFLVGRTGDFGLALLGIWMLAQVNPGIPLFAATFDPSQELAADVAGTLLQAAQSAFQVIGVGLFLALLLRHRHTIGGAVMVLIGGTLMLKGFAATLLLKPAAWDSWLRPGVSLGVAIGAFTLLFVIWLPRPAQTATCAVALLSSLIAPRLVADLWQARPPLAQFDWSYGQLLNFNGLTHAVLLVWPVLGSLYLLWLAGQPGWGLRAVNDPV
jgi:VanZ family protein